MIFDTHAHYDDEKFNDDREELFGYFKQTGDYTIINPGCDVKSSKASIAFANEYPFMYSAVGIHPEEIPDNISASVSEIYSLAIHPKCVAIGEIGLDYYWDTSRKDQQKELFIQQLVLADKLNLPVIVHDREAHGDSLEIIKQFPKIRGVFHCFSGSAEMAMLLLNMGWYLGFDGPITYKNAKKSIEVLTVCPLDRILIETDSPYLPPVPRRGTRNDSRNLSYVAEKIAEIKGVDLEEIYSITSKNACDLFEISL